MLAFFGIIFFGCFLIVLGVSANFILWFICKALFNTAYISYLKIKDDSISDDGGVSDTAMMLFWITSIIVIYVNFDISFWWALLASFLSLFIATFIAFMLLVISGKLLGFVNERVCNFWVMFLVSSLIFYLARYYFNFSIWWSLGLIPISGIVNLIILHIWDDYDVLDYEINKYLFEDEDVEKDNKQKVDVVIKNLPDNYSYSCDASDPNNISINIKLKD